MSRRAIPLVLAALALGCGTRFEKEVGAEERAVLAAPEALELLALLPSPSGEDRLLAPEEDAFRGYRVLGRAVVDGAEERAQLVGLVRRGIDAAGKETASCFLPRHGLRARRGDATVDLLLCYECLRARIYGAGAEPAEVATGAEVEPELTALFRAHGLRVAGR